MKSGLTKWLPDMDSNHDKQIQSLLCYRYTIRQRKVRESVVSSRRKSSNVGGLLTPCGRRSGFHSLHGGCR